jgi:hypothetical protein
LNTQDFIREFVHKDSDSYVDLGNYDFGLSDDEVFVRDKRTNDITELSRDNLFVSHERKVNPSYYLAVFGLLTLAFYFSIFFLRDALGEDILILVVLGLYLSPFVFRLFTSGFTVIGLYFALCIVFSLTVGSWEENQLGSGVVGFFVIGLAPYVASKIFVRIWTESDLLLSTPDRELEIRIEETKIGRIMRALDSE